MTKMSLRMLDLRNWIAWRLMKWSWRIGGQGAFDRNVETFRTIHTASQEWQTQFGYSRDLRGFEEQQRELSERVEAAQRGRKKRQCQRRTSACAGR